MNNEIDVVQPRRLHVFTLQNRLTIHLVGRKRDVGSHRGLATQKAEKIVVRQTLDLSCPMILAATQNGHAVHDRKNFIQFVRHVNYSNAPLPHEPEIVVQVANPVLA